MQQEKIQIVLRPGGTIEVTPIGIKGHKCTELTRPLLDMGESQTSLTSDYYEQEEVETQTNIDTNW